MTSLPETESAYVPGEFLVELPFADKLASVRVHRGKRKPVGRKLRRLNWTKSFDALLRDLKCVEIRRVHEPLPISGARRAATLQRMDSTFLVRVDPDGDQIRCLDLLRDYSPAVLAERNRFHFAAGTADVSGFSLNKVALNQIAAPLAMTRTRGDPSVRVAVLDSGVDFRHPLLAGAFGGGIDTVDLTFQNPPPGFRWSGDFIQADDDPSDDVGHGTHVAGIIAARVANGGIAPGCKFLAIRVLGKLERLDGVSEMRAAGKSDDIARGIREAVDAGAAVLNMSYANAALDAPGISLLERNEIALAIQRGVLPVAAMGNLGVDGPIAFPAALASGSALVAVGAIDSQNQRIPESQVGGHLSVVAPGENIVSTLPSGNIGVLTGTSMATAYVSAGAGLAQSFRRQSGRPPLSAVDLKDAILSSAQRLPSAGSSRSDQFGDGCLNLDRLLDTVQNLP